MQVPGSHRFPTLTALGVLGGISAFDNAIQGALLGPILLSCIAVRSEPQTLHTHLSSDHQTLEGGVRNQALGTEPPACS